MTGKELIREIADLGGKSQFNTEFEARAIYTAINRAIDEISKLFPVVKTVRLQNYPIRPTAFYKGITVHKGGEDIVYNASGIKSLAFAVSGTGRAGRSPGRAAPVPQLCGAGLLTVCICRPGFSGAVLLFAGMT